MQASHPDKNRLIAPEPCVDGTPMTYASVAALAAVKGPPLLQPGAREATTLPLGAASSIAAEGPLGASNSPAGVRMTEAGDVLDSMRGEVPQLVSDDEDEHDDLMPEMMSDEEDDGLALAASCVAQAGLYAASRLSDGMERGSLGGGPSRRPAYWTSTAARVRAYYESMPEASESVPLVDPALANRPTRFSSPALRGALRFSLTAGGSGLSEGDHLSFAQTVMDIEREATLLSDPVGAFTSAFQTPSSFLTAAREEQGRVLARLRWMQVPIVIDNTVFTYYYRDVLTAGLDALERAEEVSFGDNTEGGGGSSTPATDPPHARGSDDDEQPELDTRSEARERRGTLDSDVYQQERRDVQRIHGPAALVMGVQLHADEALVSWSGAHNIFPVRARYVNIVGSGGGWTTVGYIQHVPRAVGRSAAHRLAVSDVRNDLLQRCLAVSLRSLTRASETGVTATVAGIGSVFLVPRIVGLVVDQPEERAILGLMGNQCNFFCSRCMVAKDDAPTTSEARAADRDVVSTLEAQLAAALVRREDPRPSRRRALGQEHSALAFVPALAAVHGLSTGSRFLYRIASFDLLHVWKLGILRLLAQRLPAFLGAVCPDGHARLGPTADTLEVVNLRSFELGRECKVCPSAPGYVAASSVGGTVLVVCFITAVWVS